MYYIFIIEKITLRVGFGPHAVVWRPLVSNMKDLEFWAEALLF